MSYTCKFKSIRSEIKDSRIIYDLASVQEHHLKLKAVSFLLDRAVIRAFIITLMIIFPIAGMTYAGMVIGAEINFSTPTGLIAGKTAIVGLMFLFIILWAILTIQGVIRDRKSTLVLKERGEGNWKLVDENKWEHFHKMLMLAEKKEKGDL